MLQPLHLFGGVYLAICRSCQMVTDFFPSRSPALPFQTANATATLEPGRSATAPSPDGAIARFLRALRQELKKADNDHHKQLALATSALDANDETFSSAA